MPAKKEKKKKKQEVEAEPAKPDDAEYDKESLKVKISTYEMTIMRLNKENQQLKTRAEKAVKEMTDSAAQSLEMFQRLTDKMDQKDKGISKMRSELAAFEEEKNRLEVELRGQISSEREERDAMRERYDQEAAVLQQKLDEVVQFRQHKDAMTKKIEQLENEVAENRAGHAAELERLHAQHLEEREALRSDMISKWRRTRLEVYKLTEDHLQTKTQQTIQENEKLTRDVDTYAREAREMMKHNAKLKEESSSLKRSLEIEQRSVAELMKKSQQQQRAIKNLVEKLKGYEEMCKQVQADSESEKVQRIIGLGETIDNQYEVILDLKRELDETTARMHAQQAEYEDKLAAATRKEHLLTETQQFLLQCASDIKRQASSAKRSDSLLSLDPVDRVEAVAYLKRRLEGFDSGLCPRPPPVSLSNGPNAARQHRQEPIDGGGASPPKILAAPSPALPVLSPTSAAVAQAQTV